MFELKVCYVNKRHITSSERRLGGQQWRLSCFGENLEAEQRSLQRSLL